MRAAIFCVKILWTANAIGLPVIAGPSEATAIGNIMIQAKAEGIVDSLQAMRAMIRQSISIDEYTPENNSEWVAAYEKFLTVTK